MPITTTTIGAFPKPDYLPVSDWFTRNQEADYTGVYLDEVASMGDQAQALFDRATADVIQDQVDAGIDVPTDGEVRRENYVHYQCRHVGGIDFDNLTEFRLRGVLTRRLPTIVGPLEAGEPFLFRDYEAAQAMTDRPVKITLPGPLTIGDSTSNSFYGDRGEMGADLAAILNAEILRLVDAGCTHIQVDEPILARQPEAALDFGIENLAACFAGVPEGVKRIVHACCGYPTRMDEVDYPKAEQSAYIDIAERLDAAPIDQVSLEDAHRHNDLANLLPRFETTTVILGAIAIAKSEVESVDEVALRLESALEFLPPERLVAAPDCGLGYLGRDLAVQKLRVLTEAAARL